MSAFVAEPSRPGTENSWLSAFVARPAKAIPPIAMRSQPQTTSLRWRRTNRVSASMHSPSQRASAGETLAGGNFHLPPEEDADPPPGRLVGLWTAVTLRWRGVGGRDNTSREQAEAR